MEFIDVLKNRRAVRVYNGAAIDGPTVQSLIDDAVQAPSAINMQPWQFWVVLGRERIDDYSTRAKEWLEESLANDPTEHGVAQRLHLASTETPMLYHAPVVVLVTATSFEKQADEDCCVAAAMLMLAARDKEIGSCWIGSARGWFNLAETKKELGIPGEYSVVAPIILGHPKEWPSAHGRKPAAIHWVR